MRTAADPALACRPSDLHVATLVATLVADPSHGRLLAEARRPRGASRSGMRRRTAGSTAESPPILFFAGRTNAAQSSARCASALAGEPVDVIVQPPAHRRKRLLLADMDSTMIGQECIDELAAFAGLEDRGRRHHRARHARRDRLRAGAARARRPAEGPAGRRRRRGHRRRASRSRRAAAHARADHAGARRLYRPRLGRLHACSPARSRSGSASTSIAPTGS